MRRAVVISALLHVTVILLAYFGLPILFKPDPVPDQPIAVDVVSEDQLVVQPKPKPKPEPKAKPKPKPKKKARVKPKPQQVLPPPPPPQSARLEAPVKVKVKPKPKPKPKPKKKPKPKPKAKPKPKPKPKAKVAKPVPRPKAKPKPPPDKLQRLLKNLAKEKKTIDKTAKKKAPSVAAATKDAPRRSAIERRNLAAKLSQLVKQQISPCWSIPGGAKDVQTMRVEIRIQLNADGTLRGAPEVKDRSRMQSDAFYRAVAESALRALRNPGCSPFRLPVKDYDVWKDITLTFDPREAIGP